MRKGIKVGALLALQFSIGCMADSNCRSVTFTGEVADAQTYRRALGMGLAFRMEALDSQWGWIYEIGPADPVDSEFDTYIYALNPPYRGRNINNLSIEYGTLAQDAVAKEPREFWFFIDRNNGATASKAVSDILWPKTDDAQQLALTKLATLRKGSGTLQITDTEIREGTARSNTPPGAADFGEIHRIAFTVTLTAPTDFKWASELKSQTAACRDSREWMAR